MGPPDEIAEAQSCPASGRDSASLESPTGRTPWRRHFLGLQFRFTLLVLCVALAVGGLIGGLLFELTTELLASQKREQCLQLAALLARSSAPLLESGKSEDLQALADHFTTGDPVRFVLVTDRQGNTLALADPADSCITSSNGPESSRPNDGTLGRAIFVAERNGQAAHLQTTYPIIAPDTSTDPHEQRQLLGYVRVGLNVQGAMHDLAAVFDLSSGISLAGLLLAVPLAYFVVRCVVVPLNGLSRLVRRFAAGDLDARSSVRRSDEIGELSDAFNTMADELTHKHDQILRLNADLEERVQQRTRQLRELASRDPLTGLYNRRHFSEVLTARFSESVRYGAELSCLMMDLDDFKTVNDRFGHKTGDDVLILAARTITSQLRAADVAARFGGDEFIVLLPQTDAERAAVVAERVYAKFKQELAEQHPQVSVSISIGIASVADTESETGEGLTHVADDALYQAKSLGKSRIVMASAAAQ